MARPHVCVVVLNYNGILHIEECLKSVLRNNYPSFELIVVDNCSTDGSAEKAYSLIRSDSRATIIHNEVNLGFSVGNNIGFAETRASYVIVLNNDTQVEERFIEELVQKAEHDASTASVGCRIVQSDGTIKYGPQYMNFGFSVFARQRQTYDREARTLANCARAS